ncbi:hypothetical protein KCP71_25580 [Salmonella enterica subsp. enterica]|nr:hypothetical protein KCP71_25580 [Salmonella enterica subsp. enterica]
MITTRTRSAAVQPGSTWAITPVYPLPYRQRFFRLNTAPAPRVALGDCRQAPISPRFWHPERAPGFAFTSNSTSARHSAVSRVKSFWRLRYRGPGAAFVVQRRADGAAKGIFPAPVGPYATTPALANGGKVDPSVFLQQPAPDVREFSCLVSFNA